jgi:hypothetical protein
MFFDRSVPGFQTSPARNDQVGGSQPLSRASVAGSKARGTIDSWTIYEALRQGEDYIGTEAIAEEVGRPTTRFVPVKSDEQLDLQSLHRVRERWVKSRMIFINATNLDRKSGAEQ